jgi:hypothetical protein
LVVVLSEVGVAPDGDPGPVMQSIVEGLRASSSQEDLTTFTALFCDRSYAPKAPESLEITKTNGFVCIAEHGSENESADSGQRSEDGGVGVRDVGCSLLLEPPFEELVGVAPMTSNEK